MLNLRHRRLTNIDVSKLRATCRGEPLVRGGRDGQHHVAPPERRLPSASSYPRQSRRPASWLPLVRPPKVPPVSEPPLVIFRSDQVGASASTPALQIPSAESGLAAKIRAKGNSVRTLTRRL